MAEPPFLSIVVAGRNDAYGGDFKARYVDALRFNHEHLVAHDIPHELVLVEWNPVPNKPLLAELLASEFTESTMPVTVSYVVDRRYHDALTLNPYLTFLDYVAKNVGIRRASGSFILATNLDVLLGRHVLEALASKQLEQRTVYRAARVDIKLGADTGHIDWALVEDERNYARRPVLEPPLFPGATGDFVLLDRTSMHAVRGFNEVYRLARAGIDYNFLVKAYASGLDIVDIGGPVYHLNHPGSFRLSKKLFNENPAESHFGDYRWHSRYVVYNNRNAWGLSDAPVRACGQGVFHMDFEWAAVPPIVELRRVVLPGDRRGRPRP